MTRKELQRYCAKPEQKTPHFERPWSHGKYTYATNAYVLIRLPRLLYVEERDVRSFIGQKLDECLAWLDHAPSVWVECPSPSHADIDLDSSVAIQHVLFSAKYIQWLSTLPNCQLGLNGNHDPARIRFDGGEGLIIPREH